jgi:F-type H+-transporting ATPase subunit a
MSNLLLHIKDAYYFEVPRAFWKSHRQSPAEFPDWILRNDDDFQSMEADGLIEVLRGSGVDADVLSNLKSGWESWKHASGNHGRPLDVYLDMKADKVVSTAKSWAKKNAPQATDKLQAFLAQNNNTDFGWFAALRTNKEFASQWQAARTKYNSKEVVEEFAKGADWNATKIASYNDAMAGKVLIPQPFGTLRNAYEPEQGFCISKFMIIEVGVALFLIAIFGWLGKRVVTGDAPKGRAWNFLEGLIEFVREKVFEPSMGKEDSRRFMPLLATLFVFIFGMNLAGMIPFLGAPTAALGCTAALALVVFVVGLVCGVRAMGPAGYLKNLCPSMGLPPIMAIFIVPMLWSIEFISLFMKHGILALRLLANMVAGHAVLLGLMGLVVGTGAITAHFGIFPWSVMASVTALSMVAMSLLELFVAFLQAAMFTFLTGLFISSSIHHH